MLGKAKCRILKEIRQKIADENDIPYITRECTYQGDCSGTCPRCESELRYLERELAARQRLGRTVAVTALCAGMALGASGCDEDAIGSGQELAGAPEEPPQVVEVQPKTQPSEDDVVGYMASPEPEVAPQGDPNGSGDGYDELAGMPEEPIEELAGDVEYMPDACETAPDNV